MSRYTPSRMKNRLMCWFVSTEAMASAPGYAAYSIPDTKPALVPPARLASRKHSPAVPLIQAAFRSLSSTIPPPEASTSAS